ncbi:hypothetical protein Pelo_11202 [Pelomyxa schiedti]|nr:hypothetical protein Pelo_11202 [Pelomyxa schiedti]
MVIKTAGAEDRIVGPSEESRRDANSRWVVTGRNTPFLPENLVVLRVCDLMQQPLKLTEVSLPQGWLLDIKLNTYRPNESVVAVICRSPTPTVFFTVLDLEKTHCTQSPAVLSLTKCVFQRADLPVTTLILRRQNNTRVLVVLTRWRLDYDTYVLFQVEENDSSGETKKQIATGPSLELSQLNESQFLVSFAPKRWLCELWDCNDTNRPLKVIPFPAVGSGEKKPSISLHAGFIFQLMGQQLHVTDALSGVQIFSATFPTTLPVTPSKMINGAEAPITGFRGEEASGRSYSGAVSLSASASSDGVGDITTVPVVVLSSFSLAGALFVIVWIFVARKFKKPFWRYVLLVAIADVVVATTMIVGYIVWPGASHTKSTSCSVQGFFIATFQLANDIWVFMIAISFHRLAQGKSLLGPKAEAFVVVCAFTFTVCIGLIPLYHPASGVQYEPLMCGWCWIGPKFLWARVFSLYLIDWFIMTVVTILYIHAAFKLRRYLKYMLTGNAESVGLEDAVQRVSRGLRQLILYPIGMAMVWLPCTIVGLLEDPTSGHDTPTYAKVLEFTLPSLGIITFITFVLTADLRGDITWLKQKAKYKRTIPVPCSMQY